MTSWIRLITRRDIIAPLRREIDSRAEGDERGVIARERRSTGYWGNEAIGAIAAIRAEHRLRWPRAVFSIDRREGARVAGRNPNRQLSIF